MFEYFGTTKINSVFVGVFNLRTRSRKIKLTGLKYANIHIFKRYKIQHYKWWYCNLCEQTSRYDTKLRWKERGTKNTAKLGVKYRNLFWIWCKASFTIHHEVLIYNQVLQPLFMNCIQDWGRAKPCRVESM